MLDKFVPSLGKVIQNIPNVDFYMIDALESIKDPQTFKNYFGSNHQDSINKLEEISNNNNGKMNVFMIFGIDTLKNGLSTDNQNKLKKLLLDLKTNQHVKVIIADSVSRIKPFEYDDFYRNNVQSIYGIWIGSGITDQFTIKSSTYNKETRSQIDNNFGYNVDRGIAKLIKVLDFYSKE